MTDMDVSAKPATSNIATDNWREWNPGLDNDELTLQAVFDTLPGAGPDEIDQMVRLLENPASPYALPGAVRLRHHDCIHILLGRGLLNQGLRGLDGIGVRAIDESIQSLLGFGNRSTNCRNEIGIGPRVGQIVVG